MREKMLRKRFTEAGLAVRAAERPMRGDNPHIFQMDIGRTVRGSGRIEYFQIWFGHEDNRIEVVSIDKKLKQLTLLVHERARTYTVKRYNREIRGYEEIEEKTPNRKRHFLCGVDERQLFIATLPRGVTTVKAAHKSLKSSSVTLAEGKVPGRTVRQGEWFFVNTSRIEREAIKKVTGERRGVIKKRSRIGPWGGKPHVADEQIELPPGTLKHDFSFRPRNEIFVRGAIRHPDHKTVKFRDWRRVIKNAEPTGIRIREGINWVD